MPFDLSPSQEHFILTWETAAAFFFCPYDGLQITDKVLSIGL